MSQAGLSLPGSQHVCSTQQKSTSRLHDNRASPHRSRPAYRASTAHVIRPLVMKVSEIASHHGGSGHKRS